MSGILTADEMDVWHLWREARRDYKPSRAIAAIDVEALVDHIEALTTVITDLAGADSKYQAARGDTPSLEAMFVLGQAMSALHDVAKVIR